MAAVTLTGVRVAGFDDWLWVPESEVNVKRLVAMAARRDRPLWWRTPYFVRLRSDDWRTFRLVDPVEINVAQVGALWRSVRVTGPDRYGFYGVAS